MSKMENLNGEKPQKNYTMISSQLKWFDYNYKTITTDQ